MDDKFRRGTVPPPGYDTSVRDYFDRLNQVYENIEHRDRLPNIAANDLKAVHADIN